MASVDELVTAFGAALEGSDLDGMIAVLAPGAVVWHNRDRKVVDARENMAAIGMLGQIVRDAAIATVRLESTSGGFVYQFALRGTVVSSGKPFEMQSCIVVTTADGLITRIDEYVDPTVGEQLAP